MGQSGPSAGRGHRLYHLQPAGLAQIGGWVKHFEHYWTQRLDALVGLLDEEKP